MDKRKAYPTIKASDFGKTHKDLINSFTKTKDQSVIERLQEQSNRTLKKIVKDKRKQQFQITKNDIKLTDTNGGNFGDIDEFSPKDGIGQVKTLSNQEFQSIVINKGRSKDFSEINALMHNSKIQKGYVHYVNADNPGMQATVKHKYDFNKYTQDLNKVKRVQSFIDGKFAFNSDIQKYNADKGTFSTINEADFAADYSRLQQAKEQSIVHAGIKTNNPFMRNMRRESRTVIHGLKHGWFGKTRKFRTPFGSGMRMGSIVNSYEDFLGMSSADDDMMFDSSMAIDLETKGLQANKTSIVEGAIKKGINYKAILMQQAPGWDVKTEAPFLGKSKFNDLIKGTDLNKLGNASQFSQNIRAIHNGFKGTVEAMVGTRDQLRQEIRSMVAEAKSSKKAIFAHNANFEVNQVRALFAEVGEESPLDFSSEYRELRSNLSRNNKGIFSSFKSGQITKQQAVSKLAANQKIIFTQAMKEASEGGKLADTQDIARMLNAITQDKDLAFQTGRFGANTNIKYLADIFLDEGDEAHEGILDIHQQERIAKRMQQTIRNIENGNHDDPYTRKYLDSHKLKGRELFKDSMRKTIISEVDAGRNPHRLRDLDRLEVDGLDSNGMFDDLMENDKEIAAAFSSNRLSSNRAISPINTKVKNARMGAMIFGGILLASAATNMFTFSGSKETANTIEGLQHGSPTQDNRRNTTSFGSGFRTQSFHQSPQGQEEQEGMTWKQLGLTGLGATAALMTFKSKANKTRLNDLTYLGKMHPEMTNEQLLGRQGSTAQDVAVAGARRLENTFGGMLKAFGAGNVLSYGMYDNAEFTVNLMDKKGGTYAALMNKILNRKLIEEGVDSIMFKKGELFERINDKWKKIDGKFTAIKTVANYDLSSSIDSLAKSVAYQNGIGRVDHLVEQPFLILGGKGEWKAVGDFLDAFLHETFTKPMKLLADPLEAFRQMFPDFEMAGLDKVSKTVKKVTSSRFMPDLGLDGKELVQSWSGMLGKHAGKLAFFGTMAYFGMGTLNWGAEALAPDGTPIGDAGLLGAAAYTVRKGHELYARISDMTGLTGLRDYIEDKAPGSDGWQSTIGLTAAGAMFGYGFGTVTDIAKEASSNEKYNQFLENRKETEKFSGPLKKFFKGDMTKTGKAMRIGGAIGFALALPYTIAGFGADSSASQLAAEYAGEKEIAVKKGRFWESGFTPWEGGEIDYYRKNWYAELMDNSKNKALYGGDPMPFIKAGRAIYDPYWLEKKTYHSQPYPVTGPDGSMMGIFGPIYEATLGRIVKPVATMHASVLPEELLNNTEYDLSAMARKQMNATLEFIGLRGFAVKALKKNITGSEEIFADPDEARSAKDIDSIVRDFYDLQIGGGILTSEALRRVFQNSDSFQKAQIGASINLNPIKNAMPSWMPGSDYAVDFQHGDPYGKVKDGHSRLPGMGYSSKYEALEGLDPEDYPDIYKYKILSDVAYGSTQHRIMKGKLQNRQLTEFEQDIFTQVEQQVREKKESEMNVRDPAMYDSMLGRYTAMVTDLARSNPLETLLPISPAHKFLGPPDVEDYVEEQRYSKEYRSWGNPIDDFVLPAVSMTMNNLGLGGFDVNDNKEDYFDKVDYVKYSNLAREAQASGDLRLADQYTVKAQKTYTGKDLYSHPSDIAASLPSRERSTFNYFVGADVATKQRMLQKVNPKYRDAYLAQLDKQLSRQAQEGEMSRKESRRLLKDVDARRRAIEARRKAEIQDSMAELPGPDWEGWSPNSNTGKVKQNYLNNRARDYHDYKPRRSARSADIDSIAAGKIPNEIAKPAAYSEHYSDLNKAGVENTLVVLRPGLDNSAKVNVTLDRRDERNRSLRDWGYIK